MIMILNPSDAHLPFSTKRIRQKAVDTTKPQPKHIKFWNIWFSNLSIWSKCDWKRHQSKYARNNVNWSKAVCKWVFLPRGSAVNIINANIVLWIWKIWHFHRERIKWRSIRFRKHFQLNWIDCSFYLRKRLRLVAHLSNKYIVISDKILIALLRHVLSNVEWNFVICFNLKFVSLLFVCVCGSFERKKCNSFISNLKSIYSIVPDE